MNKVKLFLIRICQYAMLLLVLIPVLMTGCASVINKDAMQVFQSRTQPVSVTVYPVNIVLGGKIDNDRELARRLVTFLEDEGLASPVLGNATHSYPFKWGMNQAKMFQRSAEAFSYQVKNDNIQTEYALLVEVLCFGSESNVGGVEYYLVDKDGKVASASLCNSDWKEFKEVKPASPNGGVDLAIAMLRRDWKTR
jgi:hypothetical protein